MTTTAAHIKDSSKVSGSNDFNTTTKKDNGLGGFEAISLEEYDTPDQKGSDEHGDLTETPSNKKSDKTFKEEAILTLINQPKWKSRAKSKKTRKDQIMFLSNQTAVSIPMSRQGADEYHISQNS